MSEEISKLEREVASLKNRQRIGYMVAFTLLFIAIGFSLDVLIYVWLDNVPLMGFLKSYDWGKLLRLGVIWLMFELAGKLFRQKSLHRKQAELLRLQKVSV